MSNADEQMDLESMRRLIAHYQSEGLDEVPEESEWKKIAHIPATQRSKQQKARLKVLAKLIVELSDSAHLRHLVRLAWKSKGIECPVCHVYLVTDYHLSDCAMGLILNRTMVRKLEGQDDE